MDDRRGMILLLALFIGPLFTALPDTGPLIGLLLFAALTLVFILLPNQAEKRKRDE